MEVVGAKPSHVTTGIRKVLELSFVYNFWQLITGAENAKNTVIRDFVAAYSKAKVLDIGCGTGVMLDHMDKNLGVDYVGYDINQEYIDFAKKKYGDRGRFYCSSINETVLYEDNFDIASAIAILHHLDNHESEKLIELGKRSLKPGGYLILSEPVWTDEQGWLEKALMSRDRGQNIRRKEEYIALAKTQFQNVECTIIPGLMTIPWTICVLKCS